MWGLSGSLREVSRGNYPICQERDLFGGMISSLYGVLG